MTQLMLLQSIENGWQLVLSTENQWQENIDQVLAVARIESSVLSKELPCRVSPITISELREKSKQWWYQHACYYSLNENVYYYIVEDLGEDSCAIIANHPGMIAHYYQITLIDKLKASKPVYFVQSVLVKGVVHPLSCDKQLHYVTIGRQHIRRWN